MANVQLDKQKFHKGQTIVWNILNKLHQQRRPWNHCKYDGVFAFVCKTLSICNQEDVFEEAVGSNSTGCGRGCLAVPREVAPSHWPRPITSELQIFYFHTEFSSAPELETFNPMIKSSRKSFQFQMMKSLTSLPPSSASAARPSPWSYSPKQIFIFLKVCLRKVE